MKDEPEEVLQWEQAEKHFMVLISTFFSKGAEKLKEADMSRSNGRK